MPVLGPLFRHELVQIARRQRVTLWRTTYALCLVAIAALTYAAATDGFERRLPTYQMLFVTQWLFVGLLLLQFALGAAIIPQWTADVVAGEKERQTLPFLLLSDLSSREVILGKLAARLAQVLMFLLAGLPLLVALHLACGVDVGFVLWVGMALIATLLSGSGAAILASVAERTTKQATKRAAQIFASYAFWPMAADWACRAWPKVGTFPKSVGWNTPYVLDDLVALINVGNPLIVGRQVVEQLGTGRTVSDAIAPLARDYTIFHLLAATVCIAWAVRRLRPTYAEQGDGPPVPPKNVPKLLQAPARPAVGNKPVFWKMLHCDGRLGRTVWQHNLIRVVYVLAYLAVPGVLLWVWGVSQSPRAVTDTAQVFVRGLGTIVLCVLVMHSAGLAAACIGREWQKQTLDELLLTDLSTDEILAQKWLAAFWSGRWIWLWVAVQWVTGVAAGALHPLAVVPLALAWAAFAANGTSLGLYWSVRATNGQRANAWTGLCGFALVALPVVATMLVLLATNGRGGSWLLALTPPGALGLMAFSPDDWRNLLKGEPLYAGFAAACVACAAVHAAMAWLLWRAACRRFPKVIGRSASGVASAPRESKTRGADATPLAGASVTS